MHTGTHAQTCDVTVALDSNIAINASITTCIQCRVGATTVQWFAPSGALIVSGQDGVTIESGVLVVNDGEMFFSNIGNGVIPFQVQCSSNLGDGMASVYRAGKFHLIASASKI